MGSAWTGWWICLVAAFSGAWFTERMRTRRLARQVAELQLVGKAQIRERAAERTGRVRAERKLREHLAEATAVAGPQEGYHLRPIGHLQSCFSQRNGTPRQPLLVPAARAQLILRPDVPVSCLEGLEQHSHVWVLFIFHCNTDLHRLSSHAERGLKAKVAVPRLNGRRLGVLATRSPHRPCPIGLSVATVVSIDGRKLTIGGADIVDGSPVLDIKPYLPFCDSIPGAVAPDWVSDSCEDDPLAVAEVVISASGREQLEQCWSGTGAGAALRQQLFPDSGSWLALVQQTLSRDIRSVHQRLHVASCDRREGAEAHALERSADLAKQECTAAGRLDDSLPQYQVVLQGVRIMYDVNAHGHVHVGAAHAVSEGGSQPRKQER